jgi:ubiquinone/menaquinone biosynthesis C-methylase UbiE
MIQGIDWAADADIYETVCGGYDDSLFAAAAIGPRDRVLDIGCGHGRTTLTAARLASEGHAVGNDIVVSLLAQARRSAEAEGVRNVTFEQGDAQVHPFERKGFDVVISRMGTMFFADPVAAFTNIGAALRPGGRLACAVTADPKDNDLAMILGAALNTHLPPRTNEVGAPGLSSLADPGRIHEMLTTAGFEEVRTTSVRTTIAPGQDATEAADLILTWSATRGALPENDDMAMTQIRQVLIAALHDHQHPDGIRLRSTGWLFTATRA